MLAERIDNKVATDKRTNYMNNKCWAMKEHNLDQALSQQGRKNCCKLKARVKLPMNLLMCLTDNLVAFIIEL